jgi:hypothetical protein
MPAHEPRPSTSGSDHVIAAGESSPKHRVVPDPAEQRLKASPAYGGGGLKEVAGTGDAILILHRNTSQRLKAWVKMKPGEALGFGGFPRRSIRSRMIAASTLKPVVVGRL